MPDSGSAEVVSPSEQQEAEEQAFIKVSAGDVFLRDDLDLQGLKAAIGQSKEFLKKVSGRSKYDFEMGGRLYTSDDILETLRLFERNIDNYASDPSGFLEALNRDFDIFESPGQEESGDVQYTGYFEPTFKGSAQKTEEYNVPAYAVPNDLKILKLENFKSTLKNKSVAYRFEKNKVIPYHTREEIMEQRSLEGKAKVVAWLKDPVDLFFLQIQGSGILELPDGSLLGLGYAASNGRDYTSIGKILVQEGTMDLKNVSMQSIREYLRLNPSRVKEILYKNKSYTFFKVRKKLENPIGSINVPLTVERSVATDPDYFPRGALMFIETKIPNCNNEGVCSGEKDVNRYMMNQDTGGAIKGFGRVDIFFGRGSKASGTAGRLNSRGKAYIILAKPEVLNQS